MKRLVRQSVVISQNKPILLWLLTVMGVILVMLIVGGITRLTSSGLSIVEWKPVVGAVPPLNPGEWEMEFSKYRVSPQYLKLNFGMTLGEFKQIYFWEYVHRLIARILFCIVFFPTFLFLFFSSEKAKVIRLGVTMCFWVLLQGAAGWVMVRSGLIDRPSVSHYRLAIHLMLAVIMFEYVFFQCLRNFFEVKGKVKKRFWFLLICVLFQMVLGAFVAGLKAGYLFNTFPLMGGKWIPDGLFNLRPLWRNFFESQLSIQFFHRCLGLFVLGLTSVLAYFSPRLGWTVLGLGSIQVILGVATLVFQVPLLLGVLHQVFALLFLTSCVYWAYRDRVSS